MEASILDEALKRAAMGWHLHPAHSINADGGCTCGDPVCPHPGKHPSSRSGIKDATSRRDKLERWFASGDRNLQVATGRSGLVVLDIDGPEGKASLKAIRDDPEKPLPVTALAESGGGGLHYYYRYRDGMKGYTRGEKNGIGEGIETKSGETSVHLPPSIHVSGNSYRWIASPEDVGIAPVPDWIFEKCKEPPPPEPRKKRELSEHDAEKVRARAIGLLEAAAPSIQGQGGSGALFSAATCLVRGFELDLSESEALLKAHFNPRCEPAWSDRDLRRACQRAFTRANFEFGYLLNEDRPLPPKPRAAEEYDDEYLDQLAASVDEDVAPPEDEAPIEDEAAPAEGEPAPAPDDFEMPVGERVEMPKGWLATKLGVFKVKQDQSRSIVITAPCVITAILRHDDDHTVYVRLSWLDGHRWAWKVVPLEDISVRSRAERLSRFGLPVNSNNSKMVISYLTAFYALNRNRLPFARVVSHMGWQRGGGFLWGSILIGRRGGTVDVDQTDPRKWPEDTVVFDSTDGGTHDVANVYGSRGTKQGWLDAVAPLVANRYPAAQMGLLASLCTPLLEVLSRCGPSVPNFAIDFCGPTSTGKTSIIKVAASCWGIPDDKTPKTPISTWDNTGPGIERTAHARNHLPLILDDTKRAARKDQIPRSIYMVAQGQGRTRATIPGMQKTSSWRTVMIMTGETRAIDFSEDGGTRSRVVTIWGTPFGAPSEEMAAQLRDVETRMMENHGHAGPAFVRWLYDNKEKTRAWRRLFDDLVGEFNERSAGSGPMGRMSAYLGLLRLTEGLLEQAGLLPWERDEKDCVDRLWGTIEAACREADRASHALDYVRSTARARRREFFDPDHPDRKSPQGGWLGMWDVDEGVYLFPHAATSILSTGGFDVQSTLRTWVDRKIVTQRRGRVESMTVRLLRFDIETWNEDTGVKDGRGEGAEDRGDQSDLFH